MQQIVDPEATQTLRSIESNLYATMVYQLTHDQTSINEVDQLDGLKAAIRDYVQLGMPQAVASDAWFASLLNGNQSIFGGQDIIQYFASAPATGTFALNPLNTTLNKRSLNLLNTISRYLYDINVQGDAEGSPMIAGTLDRLSFLQTELTTPGSALNNGSPSASFGTITAGTTKTVTIAFTNTGLGPLNISKAAVTGTAFKLNSTTCPATLPADTTCNYTISLNSQTVGPTSGTFQINSSSATSPNVAPLVANVTSNRPSAPADVNATAGNAQATLSWTTPGSTGGSPINGYVVTPYIGLVAQAARTFTSTATTEAITGLTNGTTYRFKVAAKNANGPGPQSTASTPVTVGAPAAPTAVAAIKIASGQLTVYFTPGANNGSAITGYTATCTSTNGGVTGTRTGSASPIVVTGLTATKAYTCTVTATNAHGTSPPSTPSSAVAV
jgi:hypothetical protein